MNKCLFQRKPHGRWLPAKCEQIGDYNFGGTVYKVICDNKIYYAFANQVRIKNE